MRLRTAFIIIAALALLGSLGFNGYQHEELAAAHAKNTDLTHQRDAKALQLEQATSLVNQDGDVLNQTADKLNKCQDQLSASLDVYNSTRDYLATVEAKRITQQQKLKKLREALYAKHKACSAWGDQHACPAVTHQLQDHWNNVSASTTGANGDGHAGEAPPG